MCRLPICMGKSQTFYVMMVLTTSMFFVEITVGYLTKSMALVADSFHMLSDIISLFVGYFSFKFSKKKKNNLEKDTGNTFGWARAEVLGALINGHTGHTHSHGGNKEEKTSDPPTKESYNNEALEINLEPYNDIDMKSKQLEDSNKSYMGNISIKHGSFVSVNIDSNTEIREIEGVKAVAKTQKSKSSGQMNMKGVYLHLLGDALGSIVVIFAALIVYFFDGKQWTLYVDPGMSILMVIIITKTVIPLVKQSSMILMQNAPSSIQINTIEDKLLLKFPEIQSVHEFHVWQLTDSKLVASLHVELRAHSDYSKIAFMLKEFFHDEGIHSTTIQPEYAEKTIENGTTCRLQCSSLCEEKLCCLIEYTNSDVTSTDYRPERCSVSDVTSIDQNDVASIDKNANDIYNTQF
ncbi:proton-coupled zinc antiporter SLC30A1 isoform X3 [Hydra vulgaris]|uniref:proton-coupled zinc antiporter SLC30A1 isoform X3 n=1 Tax=Hydra vulgaris TaxID=6087 RepID=UPI001F5EC1D6|nr:zinc transporter 1 isoform X3 [Hydra vulgaris]